MQTEALLSDEFIRFKASAKHDPSNREAVRSMLAEATKGCTPRVIPGFTGIRPYPPRRTVAVSQPGKPYRCTRVSVDELVDLVGKELLGQMLGLKHASIDRWGVMVPARHELTAREILLNWPQISKAMRLLETIDELRLVALRTDMHTQTLRDLLDRFNLTHLYEKSTEEV